MDLNVKFFVWFYLNFMSFTCLQFVFNKNLDNFPIEKIIGWSRFVDFYGIKIKVYEHFVHRYYSSLF